MTRCLEVSSPTRRLHSRFHSWRRRCHVSTNPCRHSLPFVPEPTLTWALGVHIGRARRGRQGLPRHARRPQPARMPRCPRYDRRPAMISEGVRVFVMLPRRGRCYEPLPISLRCPCVFRGFPRQLQPSVLQGMSRRSLAGPSR